MLKRRLFPLLAVVFLFLSFLPSITLTYAAEIGTAADSLSKIYCDRRSGNQMNLETWYGGKCNTDNLEETIGFGDIILLDLLEKVAGSKTDDGSALEGLLIDLLGSETSTSTTPLAFSSSDSALMGSAKAISFIFQQRPASSMDYLAYVNQNLADKKIVQPAYAQEGYGFQALQPILPIWKAFRNASYFFFILAFIAYGFMIMFRIKINPQTVISIQLALPKLIATLLLITFSYAIAGLIIDFFYLITAMGFNLLTFGGVITNELYTKFVSGFGLGIGAPFTFAYIHLLFGGLTSKLLSAILVLPPALVNIMAKTIFLPLSIILSLVLAIALLYTFFKIFWMLLKSYIIMLLSIIFSPLILLGNIIPGSKTFGTWLKNIFAELSVFISTMIMFVFAFYFMGPMRMLYGTINMPGTGVGDPLANGNMWVPSPLMGQLPQDWGLGLNSEGWFALIGVGMLLMIPKLAEMIKNALQIKDLGYGSAISEGLMWGPGAIQKGAGTHLGRQLQQQGFGAISDKLGDTRAGGFFKGLSERNKPRS